MNNSTSVEPKDEVIKVFTFRAHRPGWIDGDELPIFQFTELNALLNSEWVNRFATREDFSGFAISIVAVYGDSSLPVNNRFMATYKNGTVWRVVGYVNASPEDLGLPKWESNKPGLIPPFKVNYSGKKLSEVPYDEIEIGMELISAIGNPGKVEEKINKEDAPHRDNDNFIAIKWDSGSYSQQLHFLLDQVTVK